MAPLDRTFNALADPTRRAILGRLRRGPASVNDLAAPFAVSQQAISKHVAVLKSAGLITQHKIGRRRECVLRTKPLEAALKWMDVYRPIWDERLDKLETYIKSSRRP